MSYAPNYERSYGNKYDVPDKVFGKRYTDTSDIAKLVRADIKTAIKDGEIPGTMRDYSVRTEKYAGGSSITVYLKDGLGIWQDCAESCGHTWCPNNPEYADSPHASVRQVLKPEFDKALKLIKGYLASYNHDGSDVMVDYFDVRFYGFVMAEGGRVLG